MHPNVNFRAPALRTAVLAALITISAGGSFAQSAYPNHAVRLVVPSSAGGGSDIVARIIAPKLSERLGQQVVVDNRAGAGTMIGGEIVAKAPPDGYTLLMAISTLATNPVVYKKMPYDALRDFAPVTQATSLPNILVVHPSVPVHTAKELIAFARAHPGQLNFGSPGTGTNPHLAMELFLNMAKIKMVHIPYKGSAPAIVDIVAGHIAVMAATALTGIPHVRSGRLRALAVTSAKRTAAAPDIPTLAESRAARLRSGAVVRRACARANAQGYRRPAAHGDRAHFADAGNQGTAARRRRRSGRQHAGRIHALHPRRNGKMGEGGARRRDQTRIRTVRVPRGLQTGTVVPAQARTHNTITKATAICNERGAGLG